MNKKKILFSLVSNEVTAGGWVGAVLSPRVASAPPPRTPALRGLLVAGKAVGQSSSRHNYIRVFLVRSIPTLEGVAMKRAKHRRRQGDKQEEERRLSERREVPRPRPLPHNQNTQCAGLG